MAQVAIGDIAVAVEALPAEAVETRRHVRENLIGVEELVVVLCHRAGRSREDSAFPTVPAAREVGILQQGGDVHLLCIANESKSIGIGCRVRLHDEGGTISTLG